MILYGIHNGFHKIISIILIQYTSSHVLLTDSLIDRLICTHNAPRNLAKAENHTQAKVLQNFRQQVT